MSKPEASGAKSLEEILASIRKSLSGEGGEAASGARGAARAPTPPRPEPPADANDANDAGDGDGLLSARLAGALNGPSNGAALDDDFMELLAPDDSKPAPSAPAGTAKPGDARSEGKDPLWFLRQPSGAAPSNGATAPTARTQPADVPPPLAPAKAPPPAPEEAVTLSRPEVLRASLPPLFGAEDRHPPATRTTPDAPKAPASVVPPAHARAPSAAPASPPAAKAQPPQPAAETAKPAAAAEAPPAPGETAPAASVEAAHGPHPAAGSKPANGLLSETPADAVAKPEPAAVREPAAAKPAPAAEATPAQARTLEQVIGELLEPVIRQWLDTNLPRLVEAAVREEVARAIAAAPAPPKV